MPTISPDYLGPDDVRGVAHSNDWPSLAERYREIREFSCQLAAPLSTEDCAIQSMPDASPVRWHLAHTTWFFETFILAAMGGHRQFDSGFEYLFNSYYNAVGAQYPRDRRGLISRPGLARILEYRHYVDEQLLQALDRGALPSDARDILVLGLNHEQQHQELMLTDVKHALSCNPAFPIYCGQPELVEVEASNIYRFVDFPECLAEVGHAGGEFAFDNESPRHKVYINAFRLASRCVSNGEYLEFIVDGGYRRPELWLSLGWQQLQSESWQAPLYWHQRSGDWYEFTLAGLCPLQRAQPVCHVSYFEADAFARWSGRRLPTEFEWEAASEYGSGDVFADKLIRRNAALHPHALGKEARALGDMFGSVWEWTSSHYSPYPGFQPTAGALGEYNGKFMCSQFVLRGGSCATSSTHFRSTYRNFFPPAARWQFSGIRLAE